MGRSFDFFKDGSSCEVEFVTDKTPRFYCEPTSITAASLALTALSTGAAMYGQYQQSKAQNAAAEYNARLAERNAKQAELEAQYALDVGKVEENKQRLQTKQLLGAQRAASASGGLLADSGSNLDLNLDTAGFGELDALTIRNNAAKDAWGIRQNAQNYIGQANLSRMSKSSPALGMTGSLLSGASSMAGQLYQYRRDTQSSRPYSIPAQQVYV